MSKKINKLLLAGEKLMIKMHSKKHELTYSARITFTKNKERKNTNI